MNIDKLLSQINSSLNVVLKQNLTPFVDKINNNNKQHELIKSILFEMPEYKNLEKRCDELQKKYDILKKELKNREIGLEISEKETSDEFEDDNAEDIDLSRWRNGMGNLSKYQTEYSDRSEDEDSDTQLVAVANKWNKAEHERVLRGDQEEQAELLKQEQEREHSEAEEESEQAEQSEAEEEEYFMIELEVDGKTIEYYTNDEENGDFYEVLENDEMGEIVGKIVDGEPQFS